MQRVHTIPSPGAILAIPSFSYNNTHVTTTPQLLSTLLEQQENSVDVSKPPPTLDPFDDDFMPMSLSKSIVVLPEQPPRPNHSSAKLQNYVLDPSMNPTAEDKFARTIAIMSRGRVKEEKKEYDSFREYIMEKPYLNPASANAHIDAGYDYHMKEMQRFWGSPFPNGDKKTVKTSKIKDKRPHDTTNKYDTTGYTTRTVIQPSKSTRVAVDHHSHGPTVYTKEVGREPIKVFGRTRVLRPFSRTSTEHFQGQQETMKLQQSTKEHEYLTPHPMAYYPYADTWVLPETPGVPINESSVFRSRTPLRYFMKDIYKVFPP